MKKIGTYCKYTKWSRIRTIYLIRLMEALIVLSFLVNFLSIFWNVRNVDYLIIFMMEGNVKLALMLSIVEAIVVLDMMLILGVEFCPFSFLV